MVASAAREAQPAAARVAPGRAKARRAQEKARCPGNFRERVLPCMAGIDRQACKEGMNVLSI